MIEMEERTYERLYGLIMGYTHEKDMINTRKALQLIRGNIENLDDIEKHSDHMKRRIKKVIHAMCVCQMLIDLHIKITKEEKDVMLTAALLHILPEMEKVENLQEKMSQDWQFDEAVYHLISVIYMESDLSEEEVNQYYNAIQDDPLALLILLADRGNIMQQLHEVPTWSAERYIFETRAFYFPMCIYAKEHYHHLLAPISVLMEKMRSLMEVVEILLRRYETREAEMVQEIIALKEENATIRGMIEHMKENTEEL